jgi:hypothetical protein
MVALRFGGSGYYLSSRPHQIAGGGRNLQLPGLKRRQMRGRQGAQAFQLWTGAEVPVEVMEKALLQAFGEKQPGVN